MTWIALAIWAGLLLAAAVRTRATRHPEQKPLAAWMIFLLVFTLVSFGLYALLIQLLAAFDRLPLLSSLPAALVFLAVVFLPAWLLADWQSRKPPRRPPEI